MNAASQGRRLRYYSLGIPVLLGLFLLILIAIFWLRQWPTGEELLGAVGKIWDLRHIPPGGWCPNYMMGVSSLIYDVFVLPNLLSKYANQFLGGFFGQLAAEKLLALGMMPAAGASMWFFLRELGFRRVAAAWTSLLYVAMPPFHVAAGLYEHRIVLICYVATPWILRGIHSVARWQAPREIVILGVSLAALALGYTKIAVALAPMLFVWMVLNLGGKGTDILRALAGYAWSVLIAVFAGVAFLLPAWREYGFAAGFLFDPLGEWQRHYSFKTPLLWVDLWGCLLGGASPRLADDRAMFWIGAVPLLALSLALGLPSLAEWRTTKQGGLFLKLVACWLVSTWISAGPYGLFWNHVMVLKTEPGLSDHAVAVMWLLLAWMGWLVYSTTSQLLRRFLGVSACITLFVMVVPVFRWLEMLPLFKDIRAPESFWKVGGFCCLAAAVGFSFVALFKTVVPRVWRRRLAVAIGLLMLVELYPVYSSYWTRGLERELFTGFDEVAAFLKSAPIEGRVHTLGTRYFYLTLPQKTGRALDTEALHHHFQLKWMRHLEAAGEATPETMRSYLNLAGVAYILIDKEDPRTLKPSQDFFRSLYPVVFENRYFAVLANEKNLFPAFLATNFVPLPLGGFSMAPAMIQILPLNIITVEIAGVATDMPGLAGTPEGPNHIDLQTRFKDGPGEPLTRIPLAGHRKDDSQRMTYKLPASASGWLVVSEAYHPDWTAGIDGRPAEVHRSECALLSVFVPPGSTEVVFEFHPPAWYALGGRVGGLAWLAALAGLVFFPSKLAPAKWRAWWTGRESQMP